MSLMNDNKGDLNSFINADELSQLSNEELSILQRNIELGEIINKRFNRSPYYPFPRDLTFSPEKILFEKWAANRQNLVEIGVFEGASSLTFRRAMSPQGILHLIDPFIEVPDSTLVARPWMAKLNLMRSWNGRVEWYRDYSYNVVSEWHKPIDFLFIDGDHAEKACQLDWDTWHQFVSIGGIVMFHDARFGKSEGRYWDGWPGPTRVVDELFRGPDKLPNWEIVDEDGTVVVVRRLF